MLHAILVLGESLADLVEKRNLVENGGVIDEYVFIVKTEDKADLAYLEKLLLRNPGRYSKRVTDNAGFDYSQMWSVVEAGNIYVKIDDDVVRFHSPLELAFCL